MSRHRSSLQKLFNGLKDKYKPESKSSTKKGKSKSREKDKKSKKDEPSHFEIEPKNQKIINVNI